jgi:hypothetical protein
VGTAHLGRYAGPAGHTEAETVAACSLGLRPGPEFVCQQLQRRLAGALTTTADSFEYSLGQKPFLMIDSGGAYTLRGELVH